MYVYRTGSCSKAKPSYYEFEWCAEGVEHAMLQSMSDTEDKVRGPATGKASVYS